MTSQSTRHVRYFSAPPLAQRPAAEPLPLPAMDWSSARLWLMPLVFLVAVITLYLLQSSFTTTSELQIGQMLKQRDAILRQNLQLSAEIAELEKPARIRERARALGFVDTSKSVRLSLPLSPTGARDAMSSSTAQEDASPWQSLFDELARWISQAAP